MKYGWAGTLNNGGTGLENVGIKESAFVPYAQEVTPSRLMVAAMCLQGIMGIEARIKYDEQTLSEEALCLADALIKAEKESR